MFDIFGKKGGVQIFPQKSGGFGKIGGVVLKGEGITFILTLSSVIFLGEFGVCLCFVYLHHLYQYYFCFTGRL